MARSFDFGSTIAAVLAASATALFMRQRVRPVQAGLTPAGHAKSATRAALETGAAALQPMTPLQAFDVYLVGFHPMKDAPDHQLEAHHYCKQVNEDFMQCVLFDGNTRDANLTGIEYIISERLFETLPDTERQYWHPHNGEILSGQLMAPGLPETAETALMRGKINSYGKTWHLWRTGGLGFAPDTLPLGEPMLAWSFNRDGEADPCLLQARDQRMQVSTQQRRQARAALAEHAHAQQGVDVLKGRFGRAASDIPGVRDKQPKP